MRILREEGGNELYGYAMAIAENRANLQPAFESVRNDSKENCNLMAMQGALLEYVDGGISKIERDNFIKENNLKLGTLYK